MCGFLKMDVYITAYIGFALTNVEDNEFESIKQTMNSTVHTFNKGNDLSHNSTTGV